MKQILLLVVSVLGLAGVSTRGLSQQRVPVTARALWGPGMSIMQEIREECSKLPSEKFGECFLSMMQKSGATPEAVAFSRQTSSMGYLRDFKEAGPVDIAFVHYPFRANENQGAFLVNGGGRSANVSGPSGPSGPSVWIDIDDQSILAQEELQKNPTYGRLAREFPDISLWPGDRNGTSYLVTRGLPAGGVRFTAGYILRKGCHACEIIGRVNFAFDFEQSGRFLGTKLLGVSAQSR
ncbi:MAG: hypothetical protein ABI882_04545 [Acidobacteriota bacterium]